MVGDISAEVLGAYHVKQTKTRMDTYAQELTKSPKAVAAIQLFKQHMRSQSNRHRIVPIDDDGDVMQECITRFTAQFYDSSASSDSRQTEVHRTDSKDDELLSGDCRWMQ